MSSDSPSAPPSSRRHDSDRASYPTPLAIELRDTQTALVRARVAVERRALTIISGTDAGRIFTLRNAEHVIGRGAAADFRVPDPDLSRLHARITLGLDGGHVVSDLDSTNGTFVGGTRVRRRELAVGDRVQCGPNLVLRFGVTDDVEEELHQRIFESSTRDDLTRAHNRRYLLDRLGAEVAYARRHGGTVVVMMMDIDGFKRVNDKHGHMVGDVVLRAITARMTRLIRAEDIFARYGSEQFAILSRSISMAEAEAFADRLRRAIGELEIPAELEPIRVTACFGGASLVEIAADAAPTELLTRAASRLSRAKAAGRDRVCIADD